MSKLRNRDRATSVNTGKLIGELPNDVHDVVVKLREAWNNRLQCPPTEIPERYHRNDLGGVLNLASQVGHKTRVEFSVLITRDTFVNEGSYRVEGHLGSASGVAQDELPMLIENIHVVDEEQRRIERIGGVIRLQRLNHVPNIGIFKSLYFSFVSSNVLFVGWPHFKNGKFDPLTVISPIIRRGKLPDDVIENRTQVVNDLPHENTEAERDLKLSMVLNCLQENLFVMLRKNWVLACLKKPIDFSLEIEDILVGPL